LEKLGSIGFNQSQEQVLLALFEQLTHTRCVPAVGPAQITKVTRH
jgi:hypothetical protein